MSAALTLHPWSTSLLLYPIFSPLRLLRSALTSTLTVLLDGLVLLSVPYALLHRTGILKRLIRKFAEFQLSKIANGAQFTIGDIEVDLLRGRAQITNLVVHTPQRQQWRWESPVIARLGRIDVSFNVLSCLDHVGPFLGFPAKDVHTVLVSDVQVFVEKRRNVFNFHLLDPSLDLPDAADVMESLRGLQHQQRVEAMAVTTTVHGEEQHNMPQAQPQPQPQAQADALIGSPPSVESATDVFSDALTTAASTDVVNGDAEDKANEIVTNVLDAVSTIGKAANEGGKEGLHTALMSQKAGFVSQLKELKAKVADGKSKAALQRSSSSLGKMAKDSIHVIKEMGKAVEKNVTEFREQVDSYHQPPPKKKGHRASKDILRFGCIVVRDVRIFMMTQKNAVASMSAATVAAEDSAETKAALASAAASTGAAGLTTKPSTDDASSVRSTIEGGWSKPIRIKEIAVSGAELCPPMRSRDENGLPGVGLPVEKVADILVKRLLAETAKTNGGRVLHTAFGEVFSWIDVKGSATAAAGKPMPVQHVVKQTGSNLR